MRTPKWKPGRVEMTPHVHQGRGHEGTGPWFIQVLVTDPESEPRQPILRGPSLSHGPSSILSLMKSCNEYLLRISYGFFAKNVTLHLSDTNFWQTIILENHRMYCLIT